MEPAIEIVLEKSPRNIERKSEDVLLFKDIKPYLQRGRNFAIVNREDWSYKFFEYRSEIPDEYDNMFVYGIGMENNTDERNENLIEIFEKWKLDSYLNKRMVIVLSKSARTDIKI